MYQLFQQQLNFAVNLEASSNSHRSGICTNGASCGRRSLIGFRAPDSTLIRQYASLH